MLFRNGEDACLDRSQPQREIAHELTSSQMRRLGHGQTSLTATLDLLSVFDKDAEEAFDGTHGCAVQHNGDVLLVVLTDIFCTEALGQVEVHLDGTALPITAEGVLQGEFKLRAVEGAFARVQDVVEACKLGGFFESGFSLVPKFVGAYAAFRTGGELHNDGVETEVVVDFLDESAEVSHFGSDLFFSTEDVSVILNEAADTHQTVHGTGRFVTVALTEFSKTHREITPALSLIHI